MPNRSAEKVSAIGISTVPSCARARKMRSASAAHEHRAALKREEKKLVRKAERVHGQLEKLRAALKALGGSADWSREEKASNLRCSTSEDSNQRT